MATSLVGKRAIVTGGGTGIGRGIALAFAEAGMKVLICGRRVEPLQATADAAKGFMGSIQFTQCDLRIAESCADVVAAASTLLGGLDVLVNNAGSNISSRALGNHSIEDWKTVIDINLNGTFHFTHAVLPVFRAAKDGGTIIMISSISGLNPLTIAGTAYCASKHGVNVLGNMINLEEGKNGIRCTNICPGEVVTEILDKRASPPTAEQRKQMILPEDVAEVAKMIVAMPPRVFIPHITVTGMSTLAMSM